MQQIHSILQIWFKFGSTGPALAAMIMVTISPASAATIQFSPASNLSGYDYNSTSLALKSLQWLQLVHRYYNSMV